MNTGKLWMVLASAVAHTACVGDVGMEDSHDLEGADQGLDPYYDQNGNDIGFDYNSDFRVLNNICDDGFVCLFAHGDQQALIAYGSGEVWALGSANDQATYVRNRTSSAVQLFSDFNMQGDCTEIPPGYEGLVLDGLNDRISSFTVNYSSQASSCRAPNWQPEQPREQPEPPTQGNDGSASPVPQD